MQSGQARTADWLLEFAPAEARTADPVMGWAGSGDTQSQVTLTFASQAEAQAYDCCLGSFDAATAVEAANLRG